MVGESNQDVFFIQIDALSFNQTGTAAFTLRLYLLLSEDDITMMRYLIGREKILYIYFRCKGYMHVKKLI